MRKSFDLSSLQPTRAGCSRIHRNRRKRNHSSDEQCPDENRVTLGIHDESSSSHRYRRLSKHVLIGGKDVAGNNESRFNQRTGYYYSLRSQFHISIRVSCLVARVRKLRGHCSLRSDRSDHTDMKQDRCIDNFFERSLQHHVPVSRIVTTASRLPKRSGALLV